jgi:hypothetical protein
MHRESHHVVDGSGEGVAAKEPGVPGCSLEEVEGKDLESHPEDYFVFGGWVDAHEFLDGRVLL